MKPVEPLSKLDETAFYDTPTSLEQTIDKLNELIAAHNELLTHYELHHHDADSHPRHPKKPEQN
jgi:hypothetical protein